MVEETLSDGRAQRSARSRARIIEALLELVAEGELLPTGEQVATLAGVGLRTVFRHFEDMDSLHAEVQERLEHMVRPLLEEPIAESRLEERVAALVRQRANVYERIAPFKRSDGVQRWRSPFLQESHAKMVRRLRTHLRAVLPEVASCTPPAQQALEMFTSFEAWERLRSDQGLGRERAEEAVRRAVLALLEG